MRTPDDLQGLDALVIPGGESTTITLGIERDGLAEPLRDLIGTGTPVLGTCAGLIVLDREHLGLLDLTCERNAFGRQVRSFEADLDLRASAGRCAARSSAPPGSRGTATGSRCWPRSTATRSPCGRGISSRSHSIPRSKARPRLHEWLLAQAAAANGGAA